MTLDYKQRNQNTFGERKEDINYTEYINWNTLAYFKTMGGIMIRPVLAKQKMLISLLKKTGDKKYQSFNDGTVIKFNAQQMDELFFHLDLGLPYTTWRKKETGSLSVWMSLINLPKFSLPNSKNVVENVKSLIIKVTNKNNDNQNREFIFSLFEYKFVLDIFKTFRNEVVKGYENWILFKFSSLFKYQYLKIKKPHISIIKKLIQLMVFCYTLIISTLSVFSILFK